MTEPHTSMPAKVLRRWNWRSQWAMDFHVLSTLAFRSWGIVAGAITILLLPLWLGAEQQGYYYTFGSLLGLQLFFELGLNQVVIQIVGHETVHLQANDLALREAAANRLGSLARLLRRWYAVAAVLFFIGCTAVGGAFFAIKGTLSWSAWTGPWLTLSALAAINLYMSPTLAMIEGLGQVGYVARVRLTQSVVGYLALWTMLALDTDLWAVIATPLVAACITGYWICRHGTAPATFARRDEIAEHSIRWRIDIFPFQWRIALSWICGYLMYNLFTPLAFIHSGPVSAGQLGLSLTIFSAVSTVGMSWVNAKTPRLASLIGYGDRDTLNREFRTVAICSSVVTALLAFIVVTGALLLSLLHVPAAMRLAPPLALIFLAWTTAVNAVIFAMAAYMRAHKEEPMLMMSLTSGALTLGIAWLSSHWSITWMSGGYALVTTVVTLPWTCLLYRRYLRRTR